MKKSVTIRKALPGEKPGYYNKTAKFLKKAEMGLEMTSSDDPQRMNLIFNKAYISLKQSVLPNILYNSLITEYVLDKNTALQIIQAAVQRLTKEGFYEEDLDEENKKAEEEAGQAEAQLGQDQAEEQQQEASEEEERRVSDSENEELALSDQGYYEGEEENNNSASHIEDEQSQMNEAFRYGGYPQYGFGGEEEESDADNITGQYDNQKGQKEKPFSMEDLMAMTPGMQGQESFPDLSYYIGDYRPIGDSYQNQNYLSGSLPEAAEGGSTSKWPPDFLKRGLSAYRSTNPLSSLTGFQKTIPVFSAIGHGMSKLPWVGRSFQPKLGTTFTENRSALFDLLQNPDVNTTGIFSKNGSGQTGGDGTYQVDRLNLYQDDLKQIILELRKSNFTPFKLSDLDDKLKNSNWGISNYDPKLQGLGGLRALQDGLISGIYPPTSKIVGGTDDNGVDFFEIKHTFLPDQDLPFGATPSNATETTFKNRFYFTTDPITGEVKVFNNLGGDLTTGSRTKYEITRPWGTSIFNLGRDALREPVKTFSGNNDSTNIADENIFGTPFPSYRATGFGKGIIPRLSEVSDIQPATLETLGWKGKIGRGLENYALGTWIPQIFGGNNPIRTAAASVNKLALPTFGYSNPALGPNVIDPANESYGSDIKNAVNYKYRLGLRTSAIVVGGLGLGYSAYDAMFNPCQCDNELLKNYKPKDVFGHCPCGTEVGSRRTLDPTGVKYNETVDPTKLQMPDSMQFLIDKDITSDRYWREKYKLEELEGRPPGDDFKKGGITESNFIKRFTSRFEEGGDAKDQSLGKGARYDTLTHDVEKRKSEFKSILKKNSNVAITKEIYKNAQGNPEILNMIMKDGKVEDLAENTETPQAQYGLSVNKDVPDWYTGYSGRRNLREYDNIFKKLQNSFPEELSSYENYLPNFRPDLYNNQQSYINEVDDINESISNNRPLYGQSYNSAEEQAKDVEVQNYMKNIPLTEGMNSADNFIPFPEVSREPVMGESWDNWYTSDGNTPGFVPDNRIWNGNDWEGAQQYGGFTDFDSENPLSKFIYGGYNYAEGGEMDEPCPNGTHWDPVLQECVPDENKPNILPTREQLFSDPEYRQNIDRLEYNRDVRDYKDYRNQMLNDYRNENYKGPMEEHDGILYPQASPEWDQFKNSKEYQDQYNKLPDPVYTPGWQLQHQSPDNAPNNVEHYPLIGPWNEEDQKRYDEHFDPATDDYPENFDENGEFLYKPKRMLKNSQELKEQLNDRYEDWCPCSKKEELMVNGRPTVKEVCIPCEQAEYGGQTYNNQNYSLRRAQDGEEIQNTDGDYRMIPKKLSKAEWLQQEQEGYIKDQKYADLQANRPVLSDAEYNAKFATENLGSDDNFNAYNSFYDKSKTEFEDYETPASNNCPPNYTWNGTACVLNTPKTNTNTNTNCPYGYVWNAYYNQCIPLATRSPNGYYPNRRSSNLLPWNSMFRGKSYKLNQGSPYHLQSRNPYTGELTGVPIARFVTKKGIFGKPKRWTDVYNIGEGSVTAAQLKDYMDQKSGPKRKQVNTDNKQFNTKNTGVVERYNRDHNDQITDDQWNNMSNYERKGIRKGQKDEDKEDRRSERYDQGKGIRYNSDQFAHNVGQFTDNVGKKIDNVRRKVDDVQLKIRQGLGNAGDKVRSGVDKTQGGIRRGLLSVGDNIKSRFQSVRGALRAQEYGGQYNFLNGGINNNIPVPVNPFNSNALLGDQSNLMGTAIQGNNSFWNNQYAFNNANNVDANGNSLVPNNPYPQPNNINVDPAMAYNQKQSKLIGVDNNLKTKRNIDPEGTLNAADAGINGFIGMLDNVKSRAKEKQMLLDNSDPFNNIAITRNQDMGDWGDTGHKFGMFRYNQEGSDRNSRATFGQYGGYMQEGGASSIEENEGRTMEVGYSNPPTYMVYDKDHKLIFSSKNRAAADKVLKGGSTVSQNFEYGGSFEQDEEVYMNPEELEQFLQAGGQVEYL